MSKNEFLDRLAWLLADISPEERDAALTYYREYIEDAGAENEEAVLQELGSPEEIAAAIKEDPAYKASRQPLTSIPTAYSQKKDSTPLIITIVLAVILSPIWIPVLVTLLSTIAGILLGAIFGGIGCMLAGIGLLIAAIVCMFEIHTADFLFPVGCCTCGYRYWYHSDAFWHLVMRNRHSLVCQRNRKFIPQIVLSE